MFEFFRIFFDVIAHRIPSEVFEPIYIAGIIGLTTIIFERKDNSQKNVLIFLTVILFAILWRMLLYSRMGTNRYFQILLIPFFIFATYGCNVLTSVSSLTKFPINKRFANIVFYSLLLFLIFLEISKTQRNDFYCYIKLQSINKHILNDMSPNSDLLILDTDKEINRIQYYSGIEKNRTKLFRDKSFISIARDIPNINYYKNVFFLQEYGTKNRPMDSSHVIYGLNHLKQICSVFTSPKKNKISTCYLYSPDTFDPHAIDPIFVQGKNKYIISPNNMFLNRSSRLYDELGFYPVISGKKSETFAKDYIAVPDKNRLILNVEIKNIGTNSTTIYIGYSLFDKDKKQMMTYHYPNNNTLAKIVSAKINESVLIIDRQPQWFQDSYVVLNAEEDLSDVPNYNLLPGTISNVDFLSDGTAKVHLTKPLDDDIPLGTTIRLHYGMGNYVCDTSKTLEPGESVLFSKSIAKYQTYSFMNSNAIPQDACFIQPLILSFSANDDFNTIEILKWELIY